MHEQPFESVAAPAQMSPTHAACIVEAGIRSLQQFTPSPHQLLPAVARHAPPIGIHCVALRVLIDPVLPTAIRFTDSGRKRMGVYLLCSRFENSRNIENVTATKPPCEVSLIRLDPICRRG